MAAGFVVIGLIVGLAQAFALMPIAHDAATYWNADFERPYGVVWGQAGAAYLYPPVLLFAMEAFRWLGWQTFILLWMSLLFLALWYSSRWLGVAALIGGVAYVAAPTAVPQPFSTPLAMVMLGNVAPLIAASIVLGFRWPAIWAFALLTKIAPGVGVLWFAARGEWRNLLLALSATAAVAGVTYFLAPAQWAAFVRFALDNVSTPSPVAVVPIPNYVLIPAGAAIVLLAGKTGRRWLVPLGVGISSFALYEWTFLPIWIAAPTLWWQDHEDASERLRAGAARVRAQIAVFAHDLRVPGGG